MAAKQQALLRLKTVGARHGVTSQLFVMAYRVVLDGRHMPIF